jgi:phage terminase small subunit
MNDRQRRFVDAYLKAPNAHQAAIAAGYAESTAAKTAHRLMRLPAVRRAIDRAQAERAESSGITQERVLRELSFVIYARLDFFVVDDDGEVSVKPGIDPEFLRAVAGVRRRVSRDFEGHVRETTFSIQLWDKNKSLALAMRHLGMLNDKLVISVEAEAQKMIEAEASDFERQIASIAARRAENKKYNGRQREDEPKEQKH